MTPRHVLVVDDSPTGRHAATTLLQKRGYQVTTAVDGEDALEKIAAARPPHEASPLSSRVAADGGCVRH